MRTGKALYRRATAQAQLGKHSEALEDVRRARGGGHAGLDNDPGVLDLFASVACACGSLMLHEKKVQEAEAAFSEVS